MSHDDHHRPNSGPDPGRAGSTAEAPPGLVAALRDLERSREQVFIPRELDRAILAKARQHLAPPPRSRPWTLRGWVPWLATATAMVLLAWLAQTSWYSHRQDSVAQAQADIDGNGRVDILDAFVLARWLQGGSVPTPPPDINGDGRVDDQDVKAIAARAVRLENKS